jgi:hypothetical protein
LIILSIEAVSSPKEELPKIGNPVPMSDELLQNGSISQNAASVPSKPQANSAPTSMAASRNAPVARNGPTEAIFKIANLNPYQNKYNRLMQMDYKGKSTIKG